MNKKQKVLYFILLIILFIGVTYLRNSQDDFEGGALEVHFIDVGQGDSILIKSNNEAMLIDGGKRSSKDVVLEYIQNERIENLKYIVATHPHEDHIGGLQNVIENIPVENILMPKVTANTKVFENLLDIISDKGLKITLAKSGDNYELDGSKLIIIAPNSEEYSNLNNYSVGIQLVFGQVGFVFTGDAEVPSEKEIVERFGSGLRADVLKLGHHGSNTSSTEDFLNAVNPKHAIVSTGDKNSYDHPHKEVLERLKKMGVEIYRTDLLGHIVVTSDGEDLKFIKQKN